LKIPLVLVTHSKVPFIANLKSLTKKQKIGMPKGYAYAEILQKKYPNLQIVDVKNSKDGLKKVKNRELFGYIGSLATVAYLFQKEYTGELKIATKFDENWELGIGVRNDDPTLLAIMQKGVNSITQNQYQEIFNRWIAIKYEQGTDYTLIFQIVAVGLLLLFFILYSNRKLTKINRKLKEAKEKADEIQKAKSNFLANISHEIRTPMNSILGTTYLIRETTLSTIQKNYILKIENATNNLLSLINDILDFSKLEAKKLQLSNVDFNLLELLDALHATFSQHIYEKSLEFEIDYDENIPKQLHGDNLKLLQILTNLLSNAIKFTEKGKIKLHIEQPTPNLFRFSISDTGIGLKQSQIADIFLSFTQADSATTRKYGGTGLGLAITKELVELMGGKIWVHSTYTKGSTFIYEIKLQHAREISPINQHKKIVKKESSVKCLQKNDATVEKLFKELKVVVTKRRPQLCYPIMEEIQTHTMSPQQQKVFEQVKQLLKKYKFIQAGELL
jgi:polar amino acid transport system substrate-binding protein